MLVLDGEPLTVERIKQAIDDVFTAHGCVADELIVSHGGAERRRPRHGLWADRGRRADRHRPLAEGPRDGLPRRHDADLLRRRAARGAASSTTGWSSRRSTRRSPPSAPAPPGCDVFTATCELFAAHGYKTLLTRTWARSLEEGFFHGLGHGVGLEVHEDPGMGIAPGRRSSPEMSSRSSPVSTGPASGAAGSRISLLVTEDGFENLTDYPYDLTP